MAKRNKVIPKIKDASFKNNKIRANYGQNKSKIIDLKLGEADKARAAGLYEMVKNILLHTYVDVDVESRSLMIMAQQILGHTEFDVDAGSRPLEKAVHASNMRGGIQKYLRIIG